MQAASSAVSDVLNQTGQWTVHADRGEDPTLDAVPFRAAELDLLNANPSEWRVNVFDPGLGRDVSGLH
jgi:hypothetical protein